ncbi:MAG: ABC transporter ATP-binding protein [Woeseia sp.]|nr:ABC transporter ATP-binding protein [Woeseia sp.]MBT8097410.1 ABC transporter ATP-binding protein [Woeseia sp.]NNE60143.1 ABC transporter ATP-binding protein [Woeseia sp.]NNL53849.1 ABC transporter ATP-binding protein [Woeseia sp.]
MSLLAVNDLTLRYGNDRPVLKGVDLQVAAGDSLGLVGESGAGKTQLALALMGLLGAGATLRGSIAFAGTELCGAEEKIFNRFRARRMAMIFQDPLQALNPYRRVGQQLEQVLREHELARGEAARNRVTDMLRQVGLPDAERQLRVYPHELSGGMRQRVMIAAALLCEPELLIADEPTTALDVTVQAQILALLTSLRQRYGLALLLISHDMGVIAGSCDRMLVLDRGRVAEQDDTTTLFREPQHERTQAMLAATPAMGDIDTPAVPARQSPLLLVKKVSASYYSKPFAAVWRRVEIPAVNEASFELAPGETLALVGESGAGKTSLARALLGLLPIAAGDAEFSGMQLQSTIENRPLALRRDMQLVFQDPVSSLNPAMRVRDIVAEPLRVHARHLKASARDDAVTWMLSRVDLEPQLADRFPRQLSGGQAQRVALARALIVQPKLLILDEAVAALDGAVRNEILALLKKEQETEGVALLFISHDLGVVKTISHRILVMYLGRIVEESDSHALFLRPRHPYTRALIDSVPVPDPTVVRDRLPVSGEAPSRLNAPAGCAFHPRCPFAVEICRNERPTLQALDGGKVACHRAAELDLGTQLAAS